LYKKNKEEFKNLFKIDAVITWVDGTNKKWMRKKNFYLKSKTSETTYASGKRDIRFGKNNELYYCVKSINKYLPWINKIYIVTMYPQKPDFLNEFNNIEIIYHHQIYNNKKHLPTFNSMSIETQLYNIPNLSEHFIYFNDDFFIGRQLEPTFFFTKKGMPILYKRNKINKYCKKNINFLKDKNIKTKNFSLIHQAVPLTKSNYKYVWNKFYDKLNKTSSSKFRNKNDIWIIGLIQQLCSSKLKNKCFYKKIKKDDNHYICFKNSDNYNNLINIDKYYNFISKYQNSKKKPALICLNNVNISNKLHKDFYDKFIKNFDYNLNL